MPAPELRLQRQTHQRPHWTIRAQNSVRQLEQRIALCRQAPHQPLPELSQRAERRVPRKDWQPGTRAGQGVRPFPFSLDVSNTKSEGNGRSAYGNQIYERLMPTSDNTGRIQL